MSVAHGIKYAIRLAAAGWGKGSSSSLSMLLLLGKCVLARRTSNPLRGLLLCLISSLCASSEEMGGEIYILCMPSMERPRARERTSELVCV